MTTLLRAAAADALALVMPVTCAVCFAPDHELCAVCARAIRPSAARVSLRVLHRSRGPDLPVFAAATYDGMVRRVLHAYKDDGRLRLHHALAPLLRCAYEACSAECASQGALLVAAPSSRASRRSRGFDHVDKMARTAGLPVRRRVLSAAPRRDQVGLTRQARFANVRGTIRCAVDLAGRDVVLLDDIVTTGATLRECARVAEGAGARVVAACVCASTPREREPRRPPLPESRSSADPQPMAGDTRVLPV